MNITRTESVQGISPVSQSSQDDYERNIQKQITDLQEKMKSITSDKEMTSEEKKSEKKEVQEKIQSLNDELRQYQIQKRQEEAAKKQEEIKQTMQDFRGDEDSEKEEESEFGSKEAGVILSLSSATEQIAGLKKIRTNLEGKLRTAETEEEKAELQEKINNISRGIGTRIKVSEETIAEYHEELRDKSGQDNNQKNRQETETRQRIIIKESDTDDLLQKKVFPQQSGLFSNVVIGSNR